jgi:hypothetical protein
MGARIDGNPEVAPSASPSIGKKSHPHESTDCSGDRLKRLAKFVAPRFSGGIRNVQKAAFDPTLAQERGAARLEPEQPADLFRSGLPRFLKESQWPA